MESDKKKDFGLPSASQYAHELKKGKGYKTNEEIVECGKK